MSSLLRLIKHHSTAMFPSSFSVMSGESLCNRLSWDVTNVPMHDTNSIYHAWRRKSRIREKRKGHIMKMILMMIQETNRISSSVLQFDQKKLNTFKIPFFQLCLQSSRPFIHVCSSTQTHVALVNSEIGTWDRGKPHPLWKKFHSLRTLFFFFKACTY